MRKYAPGPWIVDESGSIYGADGTLVADLPDLSVFGEPGTDHANLELIRQKANLRLMAASPQMIEALHMAYEVLGQPQISERRRFEVAEKIREAIDAGVTARDLFRDGDDGR